MWRRGLGRLRKSEAVEPEDENRVHLTYRWAPAEGTAIRKCVATLGSIGRHYRGLVIVDQ